MEKSHSIRGRFLLGLLAVVIGTVAAGVSVYRNIVNVSAFPAEIESMEVGLGEDSEEKTSGENEPGNRGSKRADELARIIRRRKNIFWRLKRQRDWQIYQSIC